MSQISLKRLSDGQQPIPAASPKPSKGRGEKWPLPTPPHIGRAYLTDGNRQKTAECFT